MQSEKSSLNASLIVIVISICSKTQLCAVIVEPIIIIAINGL